MQRPCSKQIMLNLIDNFEAEHRQVKTHFDFMLKINLILWNTEKRIQQNRK